MTYDKEALVPYGIVKCGPEFGTHGERSCLFEITLATGRKVWMSQKLSERSDYWQWYDPDNLAIGQWSGKVSHQGFDGQDCSVDPSWRE